MFSMFRTAVLLALALSASSLYAQTPPPGPPFDPGKHPNPIVTFVESKDFKPIAPEEVRKQAGIDLLGFSQDEARRESLDVADGRFAKNMPILSIRTDVTFYPVVRQHFKMAGGGDLVMYSFRFPKVALPQGFTRAVLNEAALEKRKKPSDMRFGGEKPEEFDIRGSRALLFEKDKQITVYWQEEGVGHTVTSMLPRKEIFSIIEDLL
jgi:hypothetical protein